MERDVLIKESPWKRRTLQCLFTLVFLAFFTLSGCSKLNPYVKVAQGGRAYANGDFQRANISYIEAGKAEEYEHWISYNLGTVYYALGETEAAESEWQVARGAQDEQLAYQVLFNYGVLLYERGAYTDAYEKFRNALEINPSGVEAKKNLELTMDRMEVSEGKRQQKTTSQLSEKTSGEIDLILNYLKNMEGEVWQSTEALQYEPLPRDL